MIPREEFRDWNLKEWEKTLKRIFLQGMPEDYEWRSLNDIVDVLKVIGSVRNLAHTFYPTGGGNDLRGANISREEGCIELDLDGLISIVKPSRLIFHSFGDKYEWAYFRLETHELEQTNVYNYKLETREPLVDSDGQYLDVSMWQQNSMGYDANGYNIPLPSSARLVNREFRGSFVIFAKGSIYNKTPDTYDARHNKVSDEVFKQHIKKVVETIDTRKQ